MYNYENEKQNLFNDQGQRMFLNVRDHTRNLLRLAGAVRMQEAIEKAGGGSSWTMLACVDRMVELGELVEVTPKDTVGQHRIFRAATL